ncbi:MAG TPA: (d)CMP kinase [Candidatus Latescibacteria bacterium]|nr:(d)CMP kinase [Candidatus Latescibacterota bacterium]
MRRKPIVAIDGPAASGKSTTARLVARRLGYIWVDTGAMYRALALKALWEGIGSENHERLKEMVGRTDVRLKERGGDLRVFLDGEDVTEAIRSPEVTHAVSWVCTFPFVRQAMVKLQREMACDGGVVMEGRDIGTVVVPDAEVKVFLDADVKERARRRWRELRERGVDVSLDEVEQDLTERDRKDTEREHAPLCRAPDALVVDTTSLSVEEQVDRIVGMVKVYMANRKKQIAKRKSQNLLKPCV